MRTILLDGMLGEPLPYLLRSDWMITCVLFFCMLLVSYVFSKEKKYLQQKLRSFVVDRSRGSLFDESTAIDVRYIFLLMLHSCIMLAFCLYLFFSHATPELFDCFSHIALLGGFIGCVMVFMGIKWLLYTLVNKVFFQKERNLVWIESFVHLFIWLGVWLLPVILLVVYFDFSSQTGLFLIAFLIIFAKIALIWKCFSNFFGKIHGALHLILYFCALEIWPDLVLWKGMEILSSNLTLNL